MSELLILVGTPALLFAAWFGTWWCWDRRRRTAWRRLHERLNRRR